MLLIPTKREEQTHNSARSARDAASALLRQSLVGLVLLICESTDCWCHAVLPQLHFSFRAGRSYNCIAVVDAVVFNVIPTDAQDVNLPMFRDSDQVLC